MAAKKTGNKLPPFVAVTWDLLNSKAYISLRPSSGKALPYFLGKGRNKTGEQRIYFDFTYSEAKRLGFSQSTFFNVICDLTKTGFIDPIFKGGLRGYKKTNSRFTLSDRWAHHSTPDFKEIRWREFIQPWEEKKEGKGKIHA